MNKELQGRWEIGGRFKNNTVSMCLGELKEERGARRDSLRDRLAFKKGSCNIWRK